MKIKMMDLVELMLERKAPKKIRFLGINMTFIETAEWGDYKGDDCNCRLSEFRLIDCLNEDAEIIEEPKKIEKITVREKTLGFPNGEWTARNMDKAFAIKINELIDEIKILKEKKDE